MPRASSLLRRSMMFTCTIAPRQDGTVDAGNHPAITYGTPVTTVPCRYQDGGSVVQSGRTESGFTLHDAILFVATTTVAHVRDKVSDIAQGSEQIDGIFEIVEDVDRHGQRGVAVFRRLLLRRVS